MRVAFCRIKVGWLYSWLRIRSLSSPQLPSGYMGRLVGQYCRVIGLHRQAGHALCAILQNSAEKKAVCLLPALSMVLGVPRTFSPHLSGVLSTRFPDHCGGRSTSSDPIV